MTRRLTSQSTTGTMPSAADDPVLGAFVTCLAHDLNNVFSVVVGGLGYVREELEAENASEDNLSMIDDALDAGRDGARLLQMALACAGRQVLRPRAVDAGGVIDGVLRLAAERFGPRFVFHRSLAPSLPEIDADPGQLEHSLYALVVNAAEAVPEGGVVTVSAGPAAIDPDALEGHATRAPYVAFTVEDAGEGMTAEVCARAREPFFSTRNDRAHKGLGLSIADGYARQSGGVLAIESSPGAGARVSIALPVT